MPTPFFKKENPWRFQKGHTAGKRFQKGHTAGKRFQKGNVPKKPFQKGHTIQGNRFPKGNAITKTHGLSYHLLYPTWRNMMNRCYDPKNSTYHRYGKIGIKVWEPWQDVRCFIFGILALLGDRPEGHSIDRINSWEGYYEWNVRWADQKTQANNRHPRGTLV